MTDWRLKYDKAVRKKEKAFIKVINYIGRVF